MNKRKSEMDFIMSSSLNTMNFFVVKTSIQLTINVLSGISIGYLSMFLSSDACSDISLNLFLNNNMLQTHLIGRIPATVGACKN